MSGVPVARAQRCIGLTIGDVWSILDGSLTEIERAVRPPPADPDTRLHRAGHYNQFFPVHPDDPDKARRSAVIEPKQVWVCPLGVTGESLWVAEPWRTRAAWDGLTSDYLTRYSHRQRQDPRDHIEYLASPLDPPLSGRPRGAGYMPRALSRIMLHITSIDCVSVGSVLAWRLGVRAEILYTPRTTQ